MNSYGEQGLTNAQLSGLVEFAHNDATMTEIWILLSSKCGKQTKSTSAHIYVGMRE